MAKPESVLVTGASGFIGGHLASELERRGYALRTHSSTDGDIADGALEFEGVGHVFHLAGLSFVPDSWNRTREYYRVNLLGTINVLEFCRRSDASLTMISTYVYGQPERLPIDEEHPVRAISPYSHTKILAEEATRYYAEQFRVRASIVRSFNTYGFGQSVQFLIPKLLAQALDRSRDEIIVADSRPRRDYLYISDLVEMLIATMERHAYGTYNAGSGRSVSIDEILTVLWSLGLKPKPLRSEHQPRAEEVFDVVADIGKAKRELGWAPRIGLREGLAAMLESMRPKS